ncbi:recombination protein RecR [Candidatus Saccharibacteria bacterium]|nr:recombination protein RecR [Candidatus Saccharibacteria bacterium]
MAQILPPQIIHLIDEFAKLPSIGPKTAERLTMYLVRFGDPTRLGEALKDLRSGLIFCGQCHSFATDELCTLCQDSTRDGETIMVVAQPLDIVALEKTGSFSGLYHVLHGVLSPIDGIGPSQIKLESLVNRVKATNPKEIVLALNATVEGETTALYIARALAPLGVKITRLAQGLSVGADVEYADLVTLGRALTGRTEVRL